MPPKTARNRNEARIEPSKLDTSISGQAGFDKFKIVTYPDRQTDVRYIRLNHERKGRPNFDWLSLTNASGHSNCSGD
jgi:hypothetical protein